MDSIKKILVQVIISLLLIFGTEPLYRDSLFQSSLEDIPQMQAKPKIAHLMKNVSFLGSMPVNL